MRASPVSICERGGRSSNVCASAASRYTAAVSSSRPGARPSDGTTVAASTTATTYPVLNTVS